MASTENYTPTAGGNARKSLAKLEGTFSKWLYLPNTDVVRVVMATVVAHRFGKTDPVWLLVVGPSGGGKTEIVCSLSSLPDVKPISNITPQTLISGFGDDSGKNRSLLKSEYLKDNPIISIKDFTNIFSEKPDTLKKILADLRDIYDGYISKGFGNDQGLVEWRGRLGLLGCTTSTAVDMQSTLVNRVMGERFVYARLPDCDIKELTRQARINTGQETQLRTELAGTVKKYFRSFIVPSPDEIEVPGDLWIELDMLAMFVANARSHVQHDSYARDTIVNMPEPEMPTRLVKVFTVLAKALAVVRGSAIVNSDDIRLVGKVALDSIPRTRARVIAALAQIPDPINERGLSRLSGVPHSTTRLALIDLEPLGVAVSHFEKRGNLDAACWKINEEYRDLVRRYADQTWLQHIPPG